MNFAQASILVSSSQPDKLALFYSLLLESRPIQGITDKDFVVKPKNFIPISFFKPSGKRVPLLDSKCSISLCLTEPASKEPLLELVEWVKEICSYGGKVADEPRLEPFGAEAWVSDIEGNNFLVFVPMEQPCENESIGDTNQ